MPNEMLPKYSTVLFTDVWEEVNDFAYDYQHIGIPTTISMSNIIVLYYLLYARYGNNPIANYDEEQWKYKIFSVIWQYGPSWEKRLDIQSKLRALSEDDLIKGSKAIYNHAYNPNQAPSTSSLEEVEYINDQNTTNYKKSKMEAYAQLWDLIDTDVTAEFLGRFQKCFKQFVAPERPLLYVTPIDEEDEDDG